MAVQLQWYDNSGALAAVKDSASGITTRYYYDNAGNITQRREYAYTTGTLTDLLDTVNYTYGDADWGDLLTAYDGQTITYDGIGNPLYDGFWTYTWEHGRQLSTIGFTGNSATFTYNADGLRIAKNFNNHRTVKYVYNGSQVTQVNVTDTDDESINYTLRIGYDALGTPLTVNFNGTTYFYATNLQGDVIAILDAEGNAVVTYTYDAWGNPTGGTRSDTDSNANALYQYNPLRYRGYIYDFETGFYYLQSRYYTPQTGRFLNADGYVSTGKGIIGNNAFAYCNNNPINLIDTTGKNPAAAIANPSNGIAAMIGAVLALVDGALPFGDAIGTGIVIGCVAYSAISSVTETTSEATVTKSTQPNGPYTVYYLRAKNDPQGTIIYVGRVKSSNFSARMSYHKQKGRQLVGYTDGLNYDECRSKEQGSMMYFHTINRNNPLNNQIRGIGPFNSKLTEYMKAGIKFANSVNYPSNALLPASYWANLTENEFLNGGL